MALKELQLDLSNETLPVEVESWLTLARQRVADYWDQFRQKPLPQYVECDFDYVAAALRECADKQWIDGRLFVEWGCGFGVITGAAALLGLDAIGIEAEDFLCQEAAKLFRQGHVDAEIWQGNFLPTGAAQLAIDEDPLVSLSHSIESAYEQHDFALEDFAIVFSYPWPGEEHFLKQVFDRYARAGALMLVYRGPYQIELYRKQ